MVPKCSTSTGTGIQYYPGKRDHNTRKDHIKSTLPYWKIDPDLDSSAYYSSSSNSQHLQSCEISNHEFATKCMRLQVCIATPEKLTGVPYTRQSLDFTTL